MHWFFVIRSISVITSVTTVCLYEIQAMESRNPLPMALEAMKSNSEVAVSPNKCNESCINNLKNSRGWIEFSPVSNSYATDGIQNLRRRKVDDVSSIGVIFYPGGKVDPRAYAIFCSQIAKLGYLTANVPMPGDLASNDRYRGYEVILAHPEIKRWIIGGHSLGGQMAGYFAAKYYNTSLIGGVFNTASYFAINISHLDLLYYSILGSRDGILNKTRFEASKSKVPKGNTKYYLINGANHGSFGYYIDYKNTSDLPSLLSRREVHNITINTYFTEFINKVKLKYDYKFI